MTRYDWVWLESESMTNINNYGGMNMQSNPFSLSFGKEPKNVLKREQAL